MSFRGGAPRRTTLTWSTRPTETELSSSSIICIMCFIINYFNEFVMLITLDPTSDNKCQWNCFSDFLSRLSTSTITVTVCYSNPPSSQSSVCLHGLKRRKLSNDLVLLSYSQHSNSQSHSIQPQPSLHLLMHMHTMTWLSQYN